MSTTPESEFNLENLFLPDWAAKPADTRRFEHVTGEEGHRGERSDRGPRRGGGGGGFGGGFGGGDRRPRGPQGGGERSGPRPPRPGGRDDSRGGPRRGGDRREGGPGGRDRAPEPREPEVKLPELDIEVLPEPRGVESLIRQIKLSGRAYPMFEIASLVLQKPERYVVRFATIKKPDGQPVQPMFVFNLDNSLWLTESDVVRYALDKHFTTFYATEKIPTEAPKGSYTFVAQCSVSGVILGPPNYHGYQEQLRALHAQRFPRLPFDAFKSRVKIVRDEAIVKKWLEEQSFKTEFACLNVPEPKKLNTRDEVEQHFREVHLPALIQPVENWEMNGATARNILSTPLRTAARRTVEDLTRFPLKLVTYLSQQFANAGLQFFKVNKTITHVSVARPHFLDLAVTPVSESLKQIVEFLNSHPRCTRRQLLEALAPTPPVPAPAPAEPTPAAEAGAEPTGATTQAPAPAPAEPSPAQKALSADLHWLIHQGHVIEFATGILETAKRPLPKPAPARPQPKPAPAEPAAPSESAAPAAAIPGAEPTAAAADAPAASAPPASIPAAAPENTPAPAPAPETPPAAS